MNNIEWHSTLKNRGYAILEKMTKEYDNILVDNNKTLITLYVRKVVSGLLSEFLKYSIDLFFLSI